MALVFANLTSKSEPATNPVVTASITPTTGAMGLVAFSTAVITGTQNVGLHTVTPSGVWATWTQLAAVALGRRAIWLFRGTGTITPGTLSVTWTSGTDPEQTWTESQVIVDEVTGYDTGTPNDTALTTSSPSTSSLAITDLGTVDTGDGVYFCAGHETAEDVTLEASLTELAALETGEDIRTLHTGYDITVPVDETPSSSWVTSGGAWCIGVIINVAAGGGLTIASRTVLDYDE